MNEKLSDKQMEAVTGGDWKDAPRVEDLLYVYRCVKCGSELQVSPFANPRVLHCLKQDCDGAVTFVGEVLK